MKSILDFLFPDRCRFCGMTLTETESRICPLCLSMLPRIPEPVSEGTSADTLENGWRPELMGEEYDEEEEMQGPASFDGMARKLISGPAYVRSGSLYYYMKGSRISQLVQDFKYRGYDRLAVALGRTLGREMMEAGFFEGVEMIQPVPMSILRQARRGYNQAEMIARGVSEVTGIPICDNLRTKLFHRSQTHKDAAAREASMKGAFRVVHPEELEGRGVVLLDDVCTTGSTLRDAGRALTEVEGVRLYYLTLASV